MEAQPGGLCTAIRGLRGSWLPGTAGGPPCSEDHGLVAQVFPAFFLQRSSVGGDSFARFYLPVSTYCLSMYFRAPVLLPKYHFQITPWKDRIAGDTDLGVGKRWTQFPHQSLGH